MLNLTSFYPKNGVEKNPKELGMLQSIKHRNCKLRIGMFQNHLNF